MSSESDENHRSDSQRRAAGFCRRALATLLDMLFFCAISALLFLPAGTAIEWQNAARDFDRLARDVSDPLWLSHAASVLGLWIALWWCYFLVGWGLLGATPGKWICRIVIEDHRGQQPIGVSRAALRLGAYCVSSLSLGIGHLLVIFRRDRRALHDILAGTRVVHIPPRPTSPRTDIPTKKRRD